MLEGTVRSDAGGPGARVTPTSDGGRRVDTGDGIVIIYGPVESTSIARSVYERGGKRAFDLVFSVVLFVMLLPLLFVVWVSLRSTLGSGVILRQERVGRHGRTYRCIKFRTMQHCRRASQRAFDGTERRVTHKSSDDPRHTRLGRVLRRYSLDEMPQLWNVIRGQMSLVGPRPELDLRADASFRDHPRHDVRPGLTGPFQLSPLRLDGDLRAGLHLDEEYRRQMSLRHDLVLLVKTVSPVVRGTGG